MDNRIEKLLDFLNGSKSVYHAVDLLCKELEKAGYERIFENRSWNIQPGGKYFLTRNDSSVVAFRIPAQTPVGFMMSASHSDRPTFKVKEKGEFVENYTRLGVESYGGMIISPWLDRPLSVAGRAMVETENGLESKLVDIDRDLLMIPNVAIHMNRKVNEGHSWNMAKDVQPLMGSKESAGKMRWLLEEMLGGRVLGHDLYLYVRHKATVWGMDEEFISGQGLDDLQCAWGCLQGFLNASESRSIPIYCVFDSEEIGSGTMQGADSELLSGTISRICKCLGLDEDCLLSQSFMVSADNAHAIHPNHPELADFANAPVMNGGVVLKFNASQRYCTDGVAAAIFRKVCAKADVQTQTYCNRADIPGGSTLGNISLHHVSVPTADIGLAQLAMHSCYETGAVSDAIALETAMAAFYGSTLTATDTGYTLK
jgi:aspartyl aminopeptidase